jgi:nitronate monooxygenase
MALGNARKGKLKHGFAFAGQNAYRIDRIVSVAELMNTLKTEFHLTADSLKLAYASAAA